VADTDEDVREVRDALARYVDAVYRGDLPALTACFHPAAAMSGYLGEELLTGGPERFFEDVASAPPMDSTGAPYVAEVTSVEVVGDVATARLDETGFFGALAFANWFHLVRTGDGTWLIVGKLFASLPGGGE
jgi:hypothetical protein